MNKAFTLLEQAIVLLIFSLILVAITPFINFLSNKNYLEITEKKMKIIDEAIIAYHLKNIDKIKNSLPCPAQPELTEKDFDFSKSYQDETSCLTTGSQIKTNNNYYYGSVPARDLELIDSYVFDGWGNKFSYVINRNAINLKNLYHIISHGKNGFFSYNKFGIQEIDSSNIIELNNSNISTNYNNFNDAESDDLIISKTKISFLREIAGDHFPHPAICKLIKNNNYNSLLTDKISKLCLK